jgi:hypothetical protein
LPELEEGRPFELLPNKTCMRRTLLQLNWKKLAFVVSRKFEEKHLLLK